MTAATVLHTLSISAPLDAEGNPVKLEGKMTPGLISYAILLSLVYHIALINVDLCRYPEPFDVVIKPRTRWAEALVRESCSMGDA